MKQSKADKNSQQVDPPKVAFKQDTQVDPASNGYSPNISERLFRMPFSLGGSDFLNRLPGLAQHWARLHDERAEEFAKLEEIEYVDREEHCAAQWRGFETLSDKEAVDSVDAYRSRCSEYIDALLVMTAKRSEISVYLVGLVTQLLDGLRELASGGDELVASLWMIALTENVGSMQVVAESKPELLRGRARRQFSIPGLISRSPWHKKRNEQLLQTLDQGEDALIYCPQAKRGRPVDFGGINGLALNLIIHIERVRYLFQQHKFLYKGSSLRIEDWQKRALELGEFSKCSWRPWLELAWEVLKESSPEKNPAIHPFMKKTFPVRKKRMNEYRKEVTSRSVGENDVKQALGDAFELLATGESPRKRQRARSSPGRNSSDKLG